MQQAAMLFNAILAHASTKKKKTSGAMV